MKSTGLRACNSLIMSGFALISFHLAEASLLYLLLRGFVLLCVKLSKNIKKCLLFIIIQIFSTHYAIDLFCLPNLKRKQNIKQQPHHVYEWTKSKQKQNQVTSHSNCTRILLFYLVHKQCNGIVKGLLHCLTSESNGRLPVNNILFFVSVWYLVMAQIQFSLMKKIKIGHPEDSLTPHLPTSNSISFLPYPLPPVRPSLSSPFKKDAIWERKRGWRSILL